MLTLRLPFFGNSRTRRRKSRKASKQDVFSKRMWVLGLATSAVAIVMLLTAPIINGYFTPNAQSAVAPSINLSNVKATTPTTFNGYLHATGVLTEVQLRELARVNPSLHARVMKTVGDNKPIVVSAHEARMLAVLTDKSNQEIKAAGISAAVVTALIVTIVYLVKAYGEYRDGKLTLKEIPDNILIAFLSALACVFTLGAVCPAPGTVKL